MASNQSLVKAWQKLDLILKKDEGSPEQNKRLHESQSTPYMRLKTPQNNLRSSASNFHIRPQTAKARPGTAKIGTQSKIRVTRPSTALAKRPMSGLSLPGHGRPPAIDIRTPTTMMGTLFSPMSAISTKMGSYSTLSNLKRTQFSEDLARQYSPKQKYFDENTILHSIHIKELSKLYEAKCIDNKNDFNENQLKHFVDKFNKSCKRRELNFEDQNLGPCAGTELANLLYYNDHFVRLNLSKNQLTDTGAQYIAAALRKNQSIIHVDLSNNNIGYEGAQAVFEVLGENETIISLCLNSHEGLYRNRLDSRGLEPIEESLQKNQVLQFLNLGGAAIGLQGCFSLAKGLENNNTLLVLDISNNDLGPSCTVPIAKAVASSRIQDFNIAGNKLGDKGVINLLQMFAPMGSNQASVEKLNLSNNNVTSLGAAKMFDMLCKNGSIRHLNVSRNNLTGKGVFSLVNMLWENHVIRSLNISDCGMGTDGADALANGLQKNKSLETLIAYKNQFKDPGMKAICSSLKEHLKMKRVDFSACKLKDEGGVALAEVIKNNINFQKVDARDNTFYDNAGFALVDAVKVNKNMVRLKLDRNPMAYKYVTEIASSIEKNISEINRRKAAHLGTKLDDLKDFEQQKFVVAEQKRNLDIKKTDVLEELQDYQKLFDAVKKEEHGKYEVIDKDFQKVWRELKALEKHKDKIDEEYKVLNMETTQQYELGVVSSKKITVEIADYQNKIKDLEWEVDNMQQKYEKEIAKLAKELKHEESKAQDLEKTVNTTETSINKMKLQIEAKHMQSKLNNNNTPRKPDNEPEQQETAENKQRSQTVRNANSGNQQQPQRRTTSIGKNTGNANKDAPKQQPKKSNMATKKQTKK